MKIIEEELLYEMVNFRPKTTGLSMVIWIIPTNNKEKHYARIKVSTHYGDNLRYEDFFTVTVPNLAIVGDTGDIKNKDIKLLLRWIKLNESIIISYWNNEIDIAEFLEKMVAL